MFTKAKMRQQLLDRRKALSTTDALRKSVSVRDRLCGLPAFQDANLVLTYVSAKDNEVDTRGIISTLLEAGRIVACPAVATGKKLAWLQIDSMDRLIPGKFGIPEPDPTRCVEVRADASTVVLVPGIAFARDGHRIGYGGGFFDRFLRDFPGTSFGLAYDFQVLDAIPYEAHDVRVNTVLTESNTYGPNV